MIRAVIFDMDGVLIDTEPAWRRAEIDVFRQVGLALNEDQLLETTGVRIKEVVNIWFDRHPWSGPGPLEVAQLIEDEVVRDVVEEGLPKPGVSEALNVAKEAGLRVAIASSSSARLIEAVMNTLDIHDDVDVISSADDEPSGKPEPDVYLTTAAKLRVPAPSCLAIEDSPNGVLSAKRAGMICIAIPDANLAKDERIELADMILESLFDFTPALLKKLDRPPRGGFFSD